MQLHQELAGSVNMAAYLCGVVTVTYLEPRPARRAIEMRSVVVLSGLLCFEPPNTIINGRNSPRRLAGLNQARPIIVTRCNEEVS